MAETPLMPGARIGVVDLGSNTCTLAIYQLGLEGFVDRIDQKGEAVRLIRQLGPDRMFAATALEKVMNLLKGFSKTAREYGVESLMVVATSAVRDARNGQDLLERIRKEGFVVQLLSSEQEGMCGVTAAVNTLPVERGFVFDMGGGSLQIALVEDRRVQRVTSLQLGALRMTDQFLNSDPPTGPQISALRRHVDSLLAEVPWCIDQGIPLVGIGGTLRAIAKLDRRSRQWPVVHGHGYRLSLDALESIFEETSRLPMAARAALPGLADHRVDVVVAGAKVVERLVRLVGAREIRICHYGIREGVALRQVYGTNEPLVPDVREAGLHGRFPEDPRQRALGDAAGVAVGALLDKLVGPHPLRWLLVAAARLAAAGGRMPDEPHAAALLSTPLPGFMQEEVLVLVDLLSPAVGPPRTMDWDDRDRLRSLLELAVDLELDGKWSIEGKKLIVDGRTYRRLSPLMVKRFGRVLGVTLEKG